MFAEVAAEIIDVTEEAEDAEAEEIDFVEITNILSSQSDLSEDDDNNHLPPHYRCASHTLNLIATEDSNQAMKPSKLKKVHHSTFSNYQFL